MLGEMLVVSRAFNTGFDCLLDMTLDEWYSLMPAAIQSADAIFKKFKAKK